MTHAFAFDPVAHRYTIDGRTVPGVTSVLADLIPGWRASDWYLGRGQAVHGCAALIAQGKDFTFDPAIAGQVAALRRFFSEVRPDVLKSEVPVYSSRYNYAGTFDLLCELSGVRCLMDWKASVGPSVPYQLAAYSVAYDNFVRYGYGVQINADGTYKMTERYDLRRYSAKWLALLTAWNVRRECGIKENKGEEPTDGN